MMADRDDILLNSREVAFLLDMSPDTVNEFARRNILPAFKKGRQWPNVSSREESTRPPEQDGGEKLGPFASPYRITDPPGMNDGRTARE